MEKFTPEELTVVDRLIIEANDTIDELIPLFGPESEAVIGMETVKGWLQGIREAGWWVSTP